MCGICGIFEYQRGAAVDHDLLVRMNDTMVHRGPDDAGYLHRPGVGLAMRRLSIIDRAGGHQPVPNEDERIWVVLNGEIYNYRALREQMLARGHTLRTRSDTEVIVHLYEEYGADCVRHLDGMFAFALYDGRPGPNGPKLLIARDPFGKKPLYYADVAGTLVFGSEMKPVIADPRVARELDPAAVHHFLSLLMVPTPLSIFRSVRKLPAGHLLEADATGVHIRSYFQPIDRALEPMAAVQDPEREIRRLLFAAVEKRLIAEVPLGAFLSGGLDSSAVVAIMSRILTEPVKTFSVGFEGPETHNELPYARAVARHCKTDHHEILLKPDIVQLLPELVTYADEPFAISSAIPTYLLSRAARRDVTVVLTGDGGDEIFGGYGQYLFERWAQAWRKLPRSADRWVERGAGFLPGRVDGRLGRLRSQITRFVRNTRRPLGARRLGWASGFAEEEKQSLYSPAWRARATTSTESFLFDRLDARAHALPPDVQMNLLDQMVFLPDEMLTKVDRMTMASSVEARSPLLDRDLAAFAAGLSLTRKSPGWRTSGLKHLLRRSVADLLPPEVQRPRKWGFNVPLDAWFRGGARAYLHAQLSPERVRQRGVFDVAAVQDLLARQERGDANLNNRLYALLVFHTWAEQML